MLLHEKNQENKKQIREEIARTYVSGQISTQFRRIPQYSLHILLLKT